jgi:hypothetical protein
MCLQAAELRFSSRPSSTAHACVLPRRSAVRMSGSSRWSNHWSGRVPLVLAFAASASRSYFSCSRRLASRSLSANLVTSSPPCVDEREPSTRGLLHVAPVASLRPGALGRKLGPDSGPLVSVVSLAPVSPLVDENDSLGGRIAEASTARRNRDTDLGAALGPRTTGKLRTTAANDGQPIVQVSSRFRASAQVVRSPGLSLARTKSPGLGPYWVRAATVVHGQQRH